MVYEAVALLAPTTPTVSFRAARRNSTGAANSGGVDPIHHARALKIIRLLRLTKLLRLVRFHHLLERYQDTDMYEQIMSAKLPLVFALIIFMTHLCTCVWYYIGVNGGPSGWVNQLIADGVWSVRTDITTRYIWSFHSVNPKFTEVGLEDVTPSSNEEHVFAIIAELVCGLLFGRCSVTTYSSRLWPPVCLHLEPLPCRYSGQQHVSDDDQREAGRDPVHSKHGRICVWRHMVKIAPKTSLSTRIVADGVLH